VKQEVNIIGGKFRGKKLTFPATEGLRPTPSRIRETLFNWLMLSINGARCLDAFAGSGALGFEAYSRGATEIVLLEKSPIVYKNLIQIADAFKTPSLQVICNDVQHYLSNKPKAFDIIFLDPPFSEMIHHQIIDLIQHQQCIHSGGLLYVEAPSPLVLDPATWTLLKAKKAGSVFYSLYQFNF
jgi:16S rRNA (guanine966-N2)-methyltransferase